MSTEKFTKFFSDKFGTESFAIFFKILVFLKKFWKENNLVYVDHDNNKPRQHYN